ncbi:MAG: 2-oxoglutarate dehydrogenase E1 component [Planctomycetes bacterium]|nr:2-oxoglutarate dehydrogenase E1 component [Planctomycetota bacterium]
MSRLRFATRWNLDAIESAYQRWRKDPDSVDDSWRLFFEGFELGADDSRPLATDSGVKAAEQATVIRLIQVYRDLGHFLARLDPLGEPRKSHPQLELSAFDLDDADLDHFFHAGNFLGLPQGKLRDILAALRTTYCRTIGVEYTHIQDTSIRRWLQERMEPNLNQPGFAREKKLRILRQLHYAELFERFLHTRYVGQKRFSLEGAETLIPLLEAIVERAAESGMREIVMGMAHRGRLNVLANILRKPYEEIFAEFEENYLPEWTDGDGDVKYHLGFSSDRMLPGGRPLHLSLTPNPSHLEAVDPVVEGRSRAKQTRFNDTERTLGLPLLIHGDAAFAGQGLVAETLNLSGLAGYTTGGTIHVIVNNQIGFTTAPADARSTVYCTDVAKMIQAPIFHVNGEDPEAAVYVAELALDFRQTFHRDVVLDLFCYRRHGHNEGDEPAFTQPLMYSKIRERPTLTEVYTEQLILSGDLTVAEQEALVEKFQAKLQGALEEVKAGPPAVSGMNGFSGTWRALAPSYSHTPVATGTPRETLEAVAAALQRLPKSFTVHPKIARLLEQRGEEVAKGQAIDWPFAELLAFGSLLLEGMPVRLSGQDSRRGTFSQRHAVLYDARTGEPFSPLNALGPEQALFQIYDSLLSEAAVLGFEFGYALDAPETLVLWEAQFGDFANGAQVIIDQFIAASQSKWKRDSGLVMLLPHGYEGQGPEHSSARLERYLQLCADDNLQVCYPSTPAQYFHVLRRQVKRNFRKPLVLMTPKSMLRLKVASSPLKQLTSGRFHEVLDDSSAEPARVQKVIFCSGKIYYELVEARAKTEQESRVAIVRMEQLYPFHEEAVRQVVGRYRKAKEWAWVQEESQNMGGWFFLEPRLRAIVDAGVSYVGRDASASPATGSRQIHLREQKELIEAALQGTGTHIVRAVARSRGTPRVPAPAGMQSRKRQDILPGGSDGR